MEDVKKTCPFRADGVCAETCGVRVGDRCAFSYLSELARLGMMANEVYGVRHNLDSLVTVEEQENEKLTKILIDMDCRSGHPA